MKEQKKVAIDSGGLHKLILFRSKLRMPVLTLQDMFNYFTKESLCRFFELSEEELGALKATLDKMEKRLKAGGTK